MLISEAELINSKTTLRCTCLEVYKRTLTLLYDDLEYCPSEVRSRALTAPSKDLALLLSLDGFPSLLPRKSFQIILPLDQA